MKVTSQMKQVEWDVYEVEGSTQGYKWYYDEDGVAYFMNKENMYIMGDDNEWVRADVE
jgi:hypothetical protein